MSIVRQALSVPGLTMGERCVLALIADHAGADGTAWPAVATMATHLEMNERSVRRILRTLEDRGLITTEARWLDPRTQKLIVDDGTKGRQTSSVYRLNLDQTCGKPAVRGDRPVPPGGTDGSALEVPVEVTTPQTPQRGVVDNAAARVERIEAEGQMRLFELVDHVLEHAARIAQIPERRRARWCTAHRSRAVELVARFAHAPPSMLAGHLLGQPSPYLAQYRTTEGNPTP